MSAEKNVLNDLKDDMEWCKAALQQILNQFNLSPAAPRILIPKAFLPQAQVQVDKAATEKDAKTNSKRKKPLAESPAEEEKKSAKVNKKLKKQALRQKLPIINPKEPGDLNGKKIDIWWPGDKKFYHAQVLRHDLESGICCVQYLDDGYQENINLFKTRTRLSALPGNDEPESTQLTREEESHLLASSSEVDESECTIEAPAESQAKAVEKEENKENIESAAKLVSPLRPKLEEPTNTEKPILDTRYRDYSGRRIEIWRSEKNIYVPGSLIKFYPMSGAHLLEYDNGGSECVHLPKERFRFIF
jgi:hypothetical protein